MKQGERRPAMQSGRDTVDQVARSRGSRRMLWLSALLIGIGLSIDVLWGNPVVVVLGEREVYSGSVGSLVAFLGLLLLLGTGVAAAVRSTR